ncbi:MAG TPA: ornithine cyclodeaminase family protein [Usitatibacter sp.]|jgi:ornithine cyclodeaminase|nr:ornithine cyclodeaminase family protein [Usitatibacter sp.]
MALLLREADVERLLTMQSTLELVERVHREYSTGQAIDVPRERTRLPKAALHILQGAVPSMGVFGYKAYTSSREGVRFLVYVFNAERGNLEAIVEANHLGMMRTGAAGGVAAKWLAREDAKVAGLFGAGWQAQGQLEALAAVRRLERVKVFSRTAEKLAKFCAKMRARLSLDVVPAASTEDAVKGSDIVVTITTSATPVFDGEWLAAGTHVNAAGSNSLLRQEIDETTVRRAQPVVVDSRPSALKEAGDLLPALEKGRLHLGGLTELGEVIAGTRPGRTSREQITLFESQGMAMQDLVIAAHLMRLAREQGAGSEVDLGR